MVERPAVRRIHPSDRLVTGALKDKATAIGSRIGRAGSSAQLNQLVVHRDDGAVNRRCGAVDNEVAGDRQVVAKGGVAAQRRTAQINRAREGLVTADRLGGVKRDKRARAKRFDNAGGGAAGSTCANADVANGAALGKR